MAKVTIEFDSLGSMMEVLQLTSKPLTLNPDTPIPAPEHVEPPPIEPVEPAEPTEPAEQPSDWGMNNNDPDLVRFTSEVDRSGIPWDERIHASSKATTDGGMWRKKRGVTKELIQEVEEELRATTYESSPPPESPAVAAVPVVPDPPADTPEPSVAPPGPPTGRTWLEVLTSVTKAQQGGTVTPAATKAAHVALGVEEFAEMISREDLWDNFMTTLGL